MFSREEIATRSATTLRLQRAGLGSLCNPRSSIRNAISGPKGPLPNRVHLLKRFRMQRERNRCQIFQGSPWRAVDELQSEIYRSEGRIAAADDLERGVPENESRGIPLVGPYNRVLKLHHNRDFCGSVLQRPLRDRSRDRRADAGAAFCAVPVVSDVPSGCPPQTDTARGIILSPAPAPGRHRVSSRPAPIACQCAEGAYPTVPSSPEPSPAPAPRSGRQVPPAHPDPPHPQY